MQPQQVMQSVEPMEIDPSSAPQHIQQEPRQTPNPFRTAMQRVGNQFKRDRDETSNAHQRKTLRVNQINDAQENDAELLYNEAPIVSYENNSRKVQKHFL